MSTNSELEQQVDADIISAGISLCYDGYNFSFRHLETGMIRAATMSDVIQFKLLKEQKKTNQLLELLIQRTEQGILENMKP